MLTYCARLDCGRMVTRYTHSPRISTWVWKFEFFGFPALIARGAGCFVRLIDVADANDGRARRPGNCAALGSDLMLELWYHQLARRNRQGTAFLRMCIPLYQPYPGTSPPVHGAPEGSFGAVRALFSCFGWATIPAAVRRRVLSVVEKQRGTLVVL